MVREILKRFLIGAGLSVAMLVLAVALPLAILVGRRTYASEAGSAASCMLNAITGGPRSVTFSAWSWHRTLQCKPHSIFRVRVVDALNLSPGHCEMAWNSHAEAGLVRLK